MSDTVNRRISTTAPGPALGRRTARAATGAIALVLAFSVGLPASLLDAPLVSTAYADPPPWAPAHGYRAKGKHNKHGKHRSTYRQAYRAPDVGIPSGSCNREVIGAIIGGAAGGYAGSRVGSGDGKLAATVAGTLLGLLVGGSIGRSMDEVDQN